MKGYGMDLNQRSSRNFALLKAGLNSSHGLQPLLFSLKTRRDAFPYVMDSQANLLQYVHSHHWIKIAIFYQKTFSPGRLLRTGGIYCLCCCSFYFRFNNPYVSILLPSCNNSQNRAPGYTRDMQGLNKLYDLVMRLGQAVTSTAGT